MGGTGGTLRISSGKGPVLHSTFAKVVAVVRTVEQRSWTLLELYITVFLVKASQCRIGWCWWDKIAGTLTRTCESQIDFGRLRRYSDAEKTAPVREGPEAPYCCPLQPPMFNAWRAVSVPERYASLFLLAKQCTRPIW